MQASNLLAGRSGRMKILALWALYCSLRGEPLKAWSPIAKEGELWTNQRRSPSTHRLPPVGTTPRAEQSVSAPRPAWPPEREGCPGSRAVVSGASYGQTLKPWSIPLEDFQAIFGFSS